jgi:hypothetical protein
MQHNDRPLQSPLRRALQVTVGMVVVGLAVRYFWGASAPEMRTWKLVAAAPLMGAFAYFQAVAHPRHVAIGMITLGLGATAFWIVTLFLGGLAITGPVDIVVIAFILALPAGAFTLGWGQLRKTATRALDSNLTRTAEDS